MGIFIVTALGNGAGEDAEALEKALKHYAAESDRLRLSGGTWLVAFAGSAESLRDKVTFAGEEKRLSVIVAQTSAVMGCGPEAISDWIVRKADEGFF